MKRCEVMGIVNVTPDSFSDGGKYFRPEEAVRRAVNLADEGADIIDLGAESTRPGSEAIGWKEEWARLGPVVDGLKDRLGAIRLSVDTYHPETAEMAIAAGADIINCVKSESAQAMVSLAEKCGRKIELVLPCRVGDEAVLERLGGMLDRSYLDPMIGFGTSREDDLELLRSVGELAKRGRVLVGASRKRIVKKLTGEKVTGKNLGGNLAIALWCANAGASVVRVHDVRETVQMLWTWECLGSNLKGEI